MPYAELREQRIDRPDLNSATTAQIPEISRLYVIEPTGSDQGYRRKSLDDLLACFRARKSLKEFLQDESCREDGLACFQNSG